MSETVKSFPFFRRTETHEETERREILDELRKVKDDLSNAYATFNNVREPELVEACVFEINSLQAQYAYYLRRAKECGSESVEVFRFPKY